LGARAAVEDGATIYRQGSFGVQQTDQAQFWAMDNPASTPNFTEGYGTPSSNTAEWYMQGHVPADEPFITRSAPGIGNNAGGNIETVTAPGAVRIDAFTTR